jgi:hypothetical protein
VFGKSEDGITAVFLQRAPCRMVRCVAVAHPKNDPTSRSSGKPWGYIRAATNGGLEPDAHALNALRLIKLMASAAIAEIEGEPSSI